MTRKDLATFLTWCLALGTTFALVPALLAADSPSITVEGRVADADGEPLPGAEILLRPAPSIFERASESLPSEKRGESTPWIATTRSDIRGAYRIDAPGPGLYELRVRAEGFVPRETALTPLLADRILDPVTLPRGRRIDLQVIDTEGNAAAGALVSTLAPLAPRLGFDWGPTHRVFQTDADGHVVMRIGENTSRPFDRELRVVAPGFAPASLEIVEPQRRWVVRLEAGVERKLVVRDPAGDPAGGLLVLLGDTRLPVGLTGDQGTLAVHLPAEGTTELRLADAEGHYLMERQLAAGSDETLSFDLEAPRPIPGRVVGALDGKPVAGAWVWPYGHPPGVARSDERGEIEITPLPGVPLAQAGALGHMPARARLGDDAVTIELQPAARLQGRVADGEGRGLPGLVVEAKPLLSRFGRSAGRGSGGRTRTGDDGRFALDALVAGATYEVRVDAPGWAPAAEQVSSPADGSQARVDIVLRPGIVAEGWVMDEGEAPVPGALVELFEAKSESIFPVAGDDPSQSLARSVSDGDGRFEMRDLATGAYRLEVEAPGFAPAKVPGVEVERPADTAAAASLGTVILARGAEIRGRTVDPEGAPLAGVAIFASAASGLELLRDENEGPPDATSDPTGRFVVGQLTAGVHHRLVAKKEGLAEAALAGIDPAEGEELEIVLYPASSVRGRVIDDAEAPIEGARVRIERTLTRGPVSTRRQVADTVTDAEGRFEITDLDPGPLTVTAKAESRVPASSPRLVVEPGKDLDEVVLRLRTGLVLQVRVVDADDLPVERAGVSVRREGGPGAGLQHGMTGPDGTARIEGVPTGRLVVHATHGDAGMGRAAVQVREGVDNEVQVRIDAGTEISGQVVAADGSPVPGARVWIGSGWLGRTETETSTGADGTFVLREVRGGDKTVRAEKEEQGKGQREVEVESEPIADLLLRLQPTLEVTGELLGLDFDEIAAAKVFVLGDGGARQATVKHDGTYRLEGLDAGTWRLLGQAGSRSASAELELEVGMGEQRVDLDFGQGSESLEGRVTLDGEPLEGARVQIRHEGGPRSTTTDYRGLFRLESLDAGPGTLVVEHLGARQELSLDIPAAEPVEVDLRLATLSGRVVDPDGEPLVGVRIEVASLDDPAGRTGRMGPDLPWTRAPETGEDGRFQVGGLSAGSWRISAVLEGYSQEDQIVELSDGAELGGVDFVLDPTGGLWMDVRAPGNPLQEIGIVRLDGAGQERSRIETLVDENGAVHLPSVPPGTWRFQVTAPGLATKRLVAEAPDDRPTVRLEPEAVIVLTTEPGVSLLHVRLLHADGTPHYFFRRGRLTAQAAEMLGNPRIPNVPEGRFVIELGLGDGTETTKEIEVRRGETLEVEVP